MPQNRPGDKCVPSLSDVYVTPEQALELVNLTARGQSFYADARADGTDHETAYKDAVFSYGKR